MNGASSMNLFWWSLLLCGLSGILLALVPCASGNNAMVIMLDPGHDSTECGAVAEYDGIRYVEYELNNAIAGYMRQQLSQYVTEDGSPVKVLLSRTKEEGQVKIAERIERARAAGTDLFLSIHNNGSTIGSGRYSGSMVLLTASHYQAGSARANDIYGLEERLSWNILTSLQKLGLSISEDPIDPIFAVNNQGLLRRVSDENPQTLYPNGEPEDWYGVVRLGLRAGIPSVLVEFAYVDNRTDCLTWLSSPQQLQRLAAAAVQGIAVTYHLRVKETPGEKGITFYRLP